MSYVCLWSPSWPTGADFDADLVASFLTQAPRITVGEGGPSYDLSRLQRWVSWRDTL